MSAKVKDVMTRNVVAVHTGASFREIAATLRDRRVSAFPVLDDAGTVIGVVSEADLITKEALEANDEGHPGPLSGLLHRRDLDVLSVFSRSDQDLRHQITQDVILGRFLTDPTTFTVIVKDGIVTLEGHPETTTLGHEVVAAVRHLEGVVAVRDRLSYPAAAEYVPLSGPLF